MTGIFKINNNEVFGSDGTFSGTIGSNATLPTGSVIQYVTVLNTTASNTVASDDGEAFGTSLTITSPQSGSKIIAWAIGGYAFTIGNGTSYNTRCGINFYQDSTTTFYFTGASEAHSSPGGSHLHVPGSAIAEYTSASTSDIDIKCRSGRHSSKSGKWYASATIPIRIIAMEVKQ